jgi:hypothetical protein
MPQKPPPPNPPPPRELEPEGPSVVKILLFWAAGLSLLLGFLWSVAREQRAIDIRESVQADIERAQHEAEEREKNAAIAECERNGYQAVLSYGWKVVCVRAACVPNEGSPCL